MIQPANLEDLAALLEQLFPYEFSVSQPELGSLFTPPGSTHSPSPLEQSMTWIASQHQVGLAFPSTSGTTPLNAMMILALTKPGDTLLIQRDSHISLLSGAIHSGVAVKYIQPRYDHRLNLSVGISPGDLDTMLTAHPDIDVVVLTYPNYFGIATDIVRCGEVVRQHGKILAIDAAHGAYYAYHPDLPPAAETSQAAIVTQSNHKVASTLSQASLAFLQPEQTDNPPSELVKRFYDVVNQSGFMTTSFSYPILTSLILGELYLAQRGEAEISRAIQAANHLRQCIEDDLPQLNVVKFEKPEPDFQAFDPLRVTVDVAELGKTGFEVADDLIENYHIYPEMETLRHVLFLFTPSDGEEHMERVYCALRDIAQRSNGHRSFDTTVNAPATLPEAVMTPRDVFYARHEQLATCRVAEAAGCVAAETIAAYPPGSAIIVGGERITSEALHFLNETRKAGGVLKGASDPDFKTITVINT